MSRLKIYCDSCGEWVNENEENSCVVYKPVNGDTLVFCDDDCHDEFIKEYTKDVYIDIRGTIIED